MMLRRNQGKRWMQRRDVADCSYAEHGPSTQKDEQSLEGRRTTVLTTLDEVQDVLSNSSHAINVIVLPPAAGDSGGEESDTEVTQNMVLATVYQCH